MFSRLPLPFSTSKSMRNLSLAFPSQHMLLVHPLNTHQWQYLQESHPKRCHLREL
eukprot:UN05365